ncbi:hypothetical protein DASC09_043870 [Saccharomycopsis crataegensis]|uniref:Uncharacterized protein n=1 Tax=Saccharomycopsis crataegensis TaxID=43959 RepID=A0AAV5QQB8_9ASCO|nr:hypothetical protein DASC09_043870 [Saccharomycopsis crataegensis]
MNAGEVHVEDFPIHAGFINSTAKIKYNRPSGIKHEKQRENPKTCIAKKHTKKNPRYFFQFSGDSVPGIVYDGNSSSCPSSVRGLEFMQVVFYL